MTKPLTIFYFAWLRERTGVAREDVTLPDGVHTVSALLDHLSARSAGHEAALKNRKTIRAAVNQEFSDLSGPVHPGDEVAFFPPVTGG